MLSEFAEPYIHVFMHTKQHCQRFCQRHTSYSSRCKNPSKS